jgi:hypothetical protein
MLILDLLGHDRVALADLRRIRELIATAPGRQPKRAKGRA